MPDWTPQVGTRTPGWPHPWVGVTQSQDGSGCKNHSQASAPTSHQEGSSLSTWHRIVSRWFWNVSSEGDSTNSLGNLYQCVATHTAKFFLVFRWNFVCISFCPLPPVLLSDSTEQSLAWSSRFHRPGTPCDGPRPARACHEPGRAQQTLRPPSPHTPRGDHPRPHAPLAPPALVPAPPRWPQPRPRSPPPRSPSSARPGVTMGNCVTPTPRADVPARGEEPASAPPTNSACARGRPRPTGGRGRSGLCGWLSAATRRSRGRVSDTWAGGGRGPRHRRWGHVGTRRDGQGSAAAGVCRAVPSRAEPSRHTP